MSVPRKGKSNNNNRRQPTSLVLFLASLGFAFRRHARARDATPPLRKSVHFALRRDLSPVAPSCQSAPPLHAVSFMPAGKRSIGDILGGTRSAEEARAFHGPAASGMLRATGDRPGRAPIDGGALTEADRSIEPTEPIEADVDPARRLLFSWSLRRYLDTRPPSTVVHLSTEETVGSAMAKLGRHAILAAPVIDERNLAFFGFASCLDVLRAFVRGIDPALTRRSYTAGCRALKLKPSSVGCVYSIGADPESG